MDSGNSDAGGTRWQRFAARIDAYERLLRLDKPIGTLLLLWPTLTALWLASDGRPRWLWIIVMTVGTRTLVRDIQSGSSYLSQNDTRAHFGLGPAAKADRLEIRWPGGRVDVLQNLDAGQVLTVREGEGIVAREPFRRVARP